jgi:phospholipid N-methyltransferase
MVRLWGLAPKARLIFRGRPNVVFGYQKMKTLVFSYSGTELDAMADARNYYRWMLQQIDPYLGRRAMEVGSGVGTFASILLKESHVSKLLLLEPANNLFPRLAERFATDARVETIHGYLEDCLPQSKVDSLIAVNVIEHIADDVEFLRLASERIIPGGTIILFTPALSVLYGTLDKAFEHYRRYSKLGLTDLLTRAGFRLLDIRYLNLPGAAMWFLAGKILRQKTIRPSQVRIYDRWFVPWVSKLERRWEPPFGQSLLAIGRKPKLCGSSPKTVMGIDEFLSSMS